MAFVCGVFGGAVALICIEAMCGVSPKQTQEKSDTIILQMQKEAILHGAARWGMNSNTIPPVVQFEWIKK